MPTTPHVLHSALTPALAQRLFQPLLRAIPHARFVHKADHRRRALKSAPILVALVFGQIRGLSALRALIDALKPACLRRVLALPNVCRSTLSDALNGRQKKKPDPRLRNFFQDVFRSVAFEVTRSLGRSKSTARALLAVDGSVFNATMKMLFARFDDTRNALKAHVGFDIQHLVPRFVSVTTATDGEREQLELQIRRGQTYIMDRGYLAFELFRKFKEAGAWFVTRQKEGVHCAVERELHVTQEERRLGVLQDQLVRLHDGTLPLRRVVFKAADGRVFEYLTNHTNHTNLRPLEIADLYKSRWAVETFFKFLKHALQTRHMISRSLLGFEIQLLAAMIAYLLCAMHFGPHPNGRPPVSLSGMRQLADQLMEEIIRADERNRPRSALQSRRRDPPTTPTVSGLV